MKRRHLTCEERAEILRRVDLRRQYSTRNLMREFRCSRSLIDNIAKGEIHPKPRKAKEPRRASFYKSKVWRELRYRVLSKSNGRCSCCGANGANGAVLHVDHVKPRAEYPELALEETNLQVLCDDCNMGKRNLDHTDWRVPRETKSNLLCDESKKLSRLNEAEVVDFLERVQQLS